jgi:hypothetical protein
MYLENPICNIARHWLQPHNGVILYDKNSGTDFSEVSHRPSSSSDGLQQTTPHGSDTKCEHQFKFKFSYPCFPHLNLGLIIGKEVRGSFSAKGRGHRDAPGLGWDVRGKVIWSPPCSTYRWLGVLRVLALAGVRPVGLASYWRGKKTGCGGGSTHPPCSVK